MHFASDLPLLTTDVSYLRQVLTELLHNACKYTPLGEKITVETTVTEDNWQFSVSNSGVKILASECEQIFDKFYRIPNNDPWKHGGTGLGLALVKKRVKLLGATIQAECETGQIRFTIKLPINPGASESSKISALVS
ncbi:sensor histidine kinase [Leptolyngbyaceae cyanobacterium UHCC 1019]